MDADVATDKGDVAPDGGADTGGTDADAAASEDGKIKTEGGSGYDAVTGDILPGGDVGSTEDGCECNVEGGAGQRSGGLLLLLLGLLLVFRRRR